MLDFRFPQKRNSTNWERLGLVALMLAVSLPIILLVRLNRSSRSEPAPAPLPQGPKTVEPLPPELTVDPAQLEVIRDNTLDRTEENGVLVRMLEILQQATPEQIQRASIGRVTYAQLQRQPNEYRAKLVTMPGVVRAAFRLAAPRNDRGIDAYWQLWIEPLDAPTWPVVIVCLDLPRGFPTGKDLAEEATVTGFFFKRWAYLAKDQLRTAPTLLARTIHWQNHPRPVAKPQSFDVSSLVIVGAGAAVIGVWLLVRLGRRRPRAPEPTNDPPDFSSLGGAVLLGLATCLGAARAEPPPPSQSAPPIATGRQLLEQFGIEPAQLDRLADGRPLTDEETQTLLRVLYRTGGRPEPGKEAFTIATLPLVEVERLSQPMANPPAVRGDLYTLRGRITQVEPVALDAQTAERFGFGSYFRCRLTLDSLGPAVVYARDVPQAWRQGAKPDEPGGALGVYLKTLPDAQGPMFAASRLAWYPDTPLGRLGMDVGLLDDVQDRRALVPAENEAFYQMLAAVGRARPGELLRLAERQPSYSVVPLFNAPWTQRARLIALEGIARRAVKIIIDDPDIVARIGLDHYYEIGLFTADSQDNPLIICTPTLAPGMPEGEDFRYTEQVRVAGFFYKVWTYRSAREEKGQRLFQMAPLVMAQTPVWLPSPAPPPGLARRGHSAYLLLAGIAVAAWLVWRFNRVRRSPAGGLRAQESETPVDFSKLD